MKKLLLILSFLFSFISCFSQDFPIPQNLGNKNTKVIDSGGLVTKVFIPINFQDTTNANLANYIKFNPGGIIRTNKEKLWMRDSTAQAWLPITVGTITPVNIYNSDGSLTSNRIVDINTKSLKFTSASSTTNPAGQMLWAAKTDTFLNGSGFIEGLSIYGNKRNLFPNSIQSNYMGGYLLGSTYEAKDSVYIYSVGGDFGFNVNSNTNLTKYPGFTGRTVIQGGTIDFDAVPNTFSQITTSGSTSSVNNVHAKGWWANNTSFVNLSNVNDTLDNLIDYFSGGLTTGKLLKHYTLYGKDLGNTDSSFGVFLPSATTRNLLAGNTSIGSSTNSGPKHTLEVFGNQIIKGADSVGSRFISDWTTGSLPGSWNDATPVTTITPSASGITFSGGTFDLTNHIDQGFYIGVPFWTVHQKVIATVKSGTSFGFSLRLTPTVGNGQSFLANFLLADTTGYIALSTANTVPVSSDPNNRSNLTFQWIAGDTLDIYISRQGRNSVTSMKNMRTGITSILNYSPVFTGTCNLSWNFYGGTWKFLNSMSLVYNEITNASVIGLGNSVMFGANADNESLCYFSLATQGVLGGAINMGHPAEQTLNGLEQLDDIFNYLHPRGALVEYGINESNSAVNLDSFGRRLTRLVRPMIASGMWVVMLTCTPQTGSNTVPYNDTIKAVAAREGARVADIYTATVDTVGTAMNPIYNSGDGIHYNNAGHKVASGIINDQIDDLVTISSPLNVSPIPNSTDYKVLLGLNQNNDVVGVDPNANNNYIQNISATTNPQVASFDITGHAYIYSEIRVLGTGGLTNPNFSVNKIAPGYTDAQLFNSQNLTTSSSTVTIDGASSGRLNFTTDPAINSISTGLHFFNVNSTGTYGIKFDDNGGGLAVTNGNYNPLEIYRNNGATHIYHVNRGGGLEADSTIKNPNIFTAPVDTTTWKPVVVDASGNFYKMKWAFAGSGGGGSGVTNVATGLGLSGGPITTTGTIVVDTAVGTGVIMWPRLNKLKDSIISVLGGGGGTSWAVSGNAGTTAGTNYLGSSDNVAIDFRTNATQAMRLNTGQELMIGSTTDIGAYKLQVTGDSYFNGVVQIDAAANQINIRNSGTLTYQISSANVGGTANADLYIQDAQAGLTPFVLIEGTANAAFYGTTGFSAPTSGFQLFTSFAGAYVAKTANYTLSISDYFIDCTSGSFTATLPSAVGCVGRMYIIKNSGTATTITIATTSSQTIDGAAPGILTTAVPLRVISDNANWKTF